MLSRFGEVEVNITEEVKSVCYLLTENGKDLERFSDLALEEYQNTLDKHLDSFNKIYSKDELSLENAKVMFDILNELYTLHEENAYILYQSNYLFRTNEKVKKYSLKEKVDW